MYDNISIKIGLDIITKLSCCNFHSQNHLTDRFDFLVAPSRDRTCNSLYICDERRLACKTEELNHSTNSTPQKRRFYWPSVTFPCHVQVLIKLLSYIHDIWCVARIFITTLSLCRMMDLTTPKWIDTFNFEFIYICLLIADDIIVPHW